MKAAGASAGALALGTPVVSADGHDGDLPQLSVEGNQIVDAEGNEPPLRGLTITDPKGLDVTAPARGKNASQVLDLVTDAERGWHPTLIRIVVRPQHVGEFALEDMNDAGAPPAFEQAQVESYAAEHLDPVIDQLADAGVYAIVDFQREDSLGDYDWTEDPIGTEIERFWEVVAPRYAERNHVLYELYGIPTEPGIWGDPIEKDWWADPWHQWKETAQPWVDLIREHAPETVVIVGTPGYNQSPEGVLVEEFDGANLAYAYHNYPGFMVSDEQGWDGVGPDGGGTMGAAEEVPLFVTEFGWRAESVENDSAVETFEGSTSGYGEPFVEWMESQPGLYWTAAAADPAWFTPMFSASFSDLSRDEIRQLDPYGGDVPQQCAELPCEWELLGEDEGDYDTYMGAFVKETLADLQSDVTFSESGVTRPAPPTDASVDATSDASLTLSWPERSDADHYELSVEGQAAQTTDDTVATITGLTPDTSYAVGVAVVDADGRTSAPYTVTVQTDEPVDGAPSAPESLTLRARSEGGLSATWTDVDGAQSYNVFVDGSHVEETSSTDATLPDVDRSSGPTVAVSAIGPEGESSATEQNWYPLADLAHTVDLVTGTYYVPPGDEVDVTFELGIARPAVSEVSFTAVVEAEDGGAPTAEFVDVESSVFDSVSVDEDDGSTSLQVSLGDGGPDEVSSHADLAMLTLEGVDRGPSRVEVRDVVIGYDVVDAPTEVPAADTLFNVEYEREFYEAQDVTPEVSTTHDAVEPGDTVEGTIALDPVPPHLTGCWFTLATDGESGSAPLEIVDVDSAANFETVTLTDFDADGNTSVDVELRDGAHEDVSGPLEVATATFEATGEGAATVTASDARVIFDPLLDTIDVPSASTTVEVATEPDVQPTGIVEVEGRTASTVELSWLEVANASEYAVYATEYDVTDAEVDEISPLRPPSEDALVERTESTSATIDGLDPLASYEVGVVAVAEEEGEPVTSPVAARPVTTLAEATSEAVPEIGVELESEVVTESESGAASIVLSDPPADVAGYVVEVRVADPAVASVGDVSFGSAFDLTQVRARADDGEWATFEGIAGEGIGSDGESVTLGSVALDAGDPGTTNVVVTARPLTLASGESVDVTAQSARFSVDVENWEGTMLSDGVVYEPNDASGDGLYRDVTGDGSVTNSDIIVFFDNQHTDVVQNHAELFDFDRSGDVSQADVVKLFESVAGN